MAYSNPSAPGTTSALMTAISTFAVAQGWTQDNYDGTNKKMSLHKGTCYVHFWWDDTHTDTNYPTSIAMYQSLGYIGASTLPWAHTDDSRVGYEDITPPYDLHYGRGIKYIGPGPYTSLHLFAHTDPDVLYGVIEFSPGLYRHFAFGTIEKADPTGWTGGEFCAGHHWIYTNSKAGVGSPTQTYHSFLMDGVDDGYYYGQDARTHATMHVEGLPNQLTGAGYNDKWGAVARLINRNMSDFNDNDGNAQAIIGGGMRNSVSINQFGWLLPNLANGFIPIIPCDIWYLSEQGTSDDIYYLGRVPNMGTISLNGVDPQQVITIGTDDWMCFPAVRKSYVVTTGVEESWNMGVIYKK